MKKITICVVFYNEQENLPRLLNSFKNFLKPPLNLAFEFVFVDNSSMDLSKQLVENWMKSNPQFVSRLVARKENHLSEARQEAAEQSQAPWLIYIDADTAIDWDWAQGVLKTLEALPSQAVGVGGKSYFVPTQHWHNWVTPLAELFPLGKAEETKKVRHVPTNNYLVSKEHLKKVGGFNRNLFYVGEDLDLNIRLRSQGLIYYSENFSVKHFLPKRQRQWFKKMFRYGWAQSVVSLLNKGGVSPIKAFPVLFILILAIGLFFEPVPLGLILFCCLFFPRLRFYLLSFLFYGGGEIFGFLNFPFLKKMTSQSRLKESYTSA